MCAPAHDATPFVTDESIALRTGERPGFFLSGKVPGRKPPSRR